VKAAEVLAREVLAGARTQDAVASELEARFSWLRDETSEQSPEAVGGKEIAGAGRDFGLEWNDVLVFGERRTGVAPAIRPSAYGLIADADGRLAVVSTAQGVFLPGGGLESGESPEDAVCREAVEECGIVVTLGEWTCRAIQLVYSETEAAYFQKLSTFMNGAIGGTMVAESEAGHELRWVEAASAVELLTHESHRWAVEQWSREEEGV